MSEAAPAASARVLHLINGEHYSGAERVQDLLALRLPEFGYEVEWACVKPDLFPVQRQAQETPLLNSRTPRAAPSDMIFQYTAFIRCTA